MLFNHYPIRTVCRRFLQKTIAGTFAPCLGIARETCIGCPYLEAFARIQGFHGLLQFHDGTGTLNAAGIYFYDFSVAGWQQEVVGWQEDDGCSGRQTGVVAAL